MACFILCISAQVYVNYTCQIAVLEWLQTEHPDLFPDELKPWDKVKIGIVSACAIPGSDRESPIEKLLRLSEQKNDTTKTTVIQTEQSG